LAKKGGKGQLKMVAYIRTTVGGVDFFYRLDATPLSRMLKNARQTQSLATIKACQTDTKSGNHKGPTLTLS